MVSKFPCSQQLWPRFRTDPSPSADAYTSRWLIVYPRIRDTAMIWDERWSYDHTYTKRWDSHPFHGQELGLAWSIPHNPNPNPNPISICPSSFNTCWFDFQQVASFYSMSKGTKWIGFGWEGELLPPTKWRWAFGIMHTIFHHFARNKLPHPFTTVMENHPVQIPFSQRNILWSRSRVCDLQLDSLGSKERFDSID